MLGKSAYLQVIQQQRTLKHSKLAITDMRQKPANFLFCTAQASTLAPAIILLVQALCEGFRSCSVYYSFNQVYRQLDGVGIVQYYTYTISVNCSGRSQGYSVHIEYRTCELFNNCQIRNLIYLSSINQFYIIVHFQ